MNLLRRRKWSFVAIALMIVVGAVVYVLRPNEDLRAGSVEVDSGRVNISDRVPESYRVIYRNESRAGDDVVVNIERLLVSRPFDAILRSRPESGRGRQGAKTANAFARIVNDQTTLAIGPAPAALDKRPDTFFPSAVKDGFAEAREIRRVAGRLCRIYRMAGSSSDPSLDKVDDAGDTYSELCVDEAGLVLEEIGVNDGKLLTRRVATEVDEDPQIDDDLFEAGEPTLGVRQGGGSVREMKPDSRPPEETFWELGDEPEGFEHEGRFAVVPPQAGFNDPTQRTNLIAFTSDVWVDGPDAVVVEQGATLGGSAPFVEDLGAELVDAGEIGDAELVYGYVNTEVRKLLGGGRYIRIFGTLPPSELVDIARELEEKEGGTLEFIEVGPSDD